MKTIKQIILICMTAFLMLLTILEIFSFTDLLISCFSQLKPETFLYALSSCIIALSINVILMIYLIGKITGISYFTKRKQNRAKQTDCTDIIIIPESSITIINQDGKIEKYKP